MTDARSAPMLPLLWSGSSAGRTDPSLHEPTRADSGTYVGADVGTGNDVGTGADVRAEAGAQTCIDAGTDQLSPPRAEDVQPQVVVRTSPRRRKTATAFWENGRVVVVVPTHVPRGERPELVRWLVARVMAKRPGATATDDALTARATALADRYVDGVRPASVRWVTNQVKRWGSCSFQTAEIRLSHRLRVVPDWVLDATLVHELAHLVHPDHSPAFHAVANRFPRQREALVFLEGYSLGLQTATADPT